MNKYLKFINSMIILFISVFIINISNVYAVDVNDDSIEVDNDGQEAAGNTGDACMGPMVNGVVVGFKITLYEREGGAIKATRYFNINEPEFASFNAYWRYPNTTSLTSSALTTASIDDGVSMGNIILNTSNGVASQIVTAMVNQLGITSAEFFSTYAENGYFNIEPVFYYVYCNYWAYDPSKVYNTNDVFGYNQTLNDTRLLTARDFFNQVNSHTPFKGIYDAESYMPEGGKREWQLCNMINQYVYSGKERDTCTADGTQEYTDTFKDKIHKTGYSMIRFYVKQLKCDYNTPAHFAYNRGEVSSPSGPGGQDCCEESYIKEQGGEDFYIDHPECFSGTVSETFTGATCEYNPNKNKATWKLNGTDLSIWQNIYGNMYHEDTATGSRNRFVRSESLGSSYCKLLCYENIELELPNPYKQTILLGGYLRWPTVNNSQYRLRLKSNVYCRIYIDVLQAREDGQDVDTIANTCSTKYHEFISNSSNYNLSANFAVKTTDPDYGSARIGLTQYSRTSITGDDGFVATTYNDLKKHTYSFSQMSYYILPDFVFRYQNLDTKEYESVKPGEGVNYRDLGFGVVPTSTKVKAMIDLIRKLKIGNKAQYDIDLAYSEVGGFSNKKTQSSNYTCKYNVTNNPQPPGGCECPEGTKNAGMDLTEYIRTVNTTCANAKKKYCNDTDVCRCPDDSEYPGKLLGIIGTTLSTIDRATCNNTALKKCYVDDDYFCEEGTTYEGKKLSKLCHDDPTCYDEECNYDENFSCPSDSDCPECDITSYVRDYMVRYSLTYDKAFEKAKKEVCYGTLDRKIVYRTIALNNPFPGKDGKNRIPGMNWNAEVLFEKENIKGRLKSRNMTVSGDDLYTSKTPMYVIKLNPAIIRSIRAYNNKERKSNKLYDDFNKDCKDNNDAACISDFLRVELPNLITGGTCKNATTKDKFYECEN